MKEYDATIQPRNNHVRSIDRFLAHLVNKGNLSAFIIDAYLVLKSYNMPLYKLLQKPPIFLFKYVPKLSRQMFHGKNPYILPSIANRIRIYL